MPDALESTWNPMRSGRASSGSELAGSYGARLLAGRHPDSVAASAAQVARPVHR